jgi:hypothetical protein
MAELVYNVGKGSIAAGRLNAGSTVLRAAAIITSKTGAADATLTTMAAIDAVGTVAFHSQRVTLTSVTATVDQANSRLNIDCADFSFTASAGVTALALVIYDATTDTNDTTRVPIAYYDTGFGAGLPLDGGLNITVADFLRLT